MNISNIMNSNFSRIGIRWTTDDEHYNVGDTCRNSYDWDYENDISTYCTDTPVELNGTCAVDTNIDLYFDEEAEVIEKLEIAIKNHKYAGNVIIIGGDEAEYGADEDEIIINNAIVLDIIS